MSEPAYGTGPAGPAVFVEASHDLPLVFVQLTLRTGSAFDPESAAAQKVLREIGAERFVGPDDPITPATVVVVHALSLPISSSDLRARARQGRSLAYRVPEAVSAYIRRHRLYVRDEA